MLNLELKERFNDPIIDKNASDADNQEVKRDSIEEMEDKIDLWLLRTFHNLKKEKEFFETKLDTQKVE